MIDYRHCFPPVHRISDLWDRSTPQCLPRGSLPVVVETALPPEEPFRYRLAPVHRAAADFDAGRAAPRRVPTVQCPLANLELIRKLFWTQVRGQDCAGALKLPAMYLHCQLAPLDRQSETRMT
jgi:hypothetical protein